MTANAIVFIHPFGCKESCKDKLKQNPKALKKEYVLDPKPPAPTLAEKLGLVENPSGSQLTEDDWLQVKDKSNKREDSKHPCVICKEDFGTAEQVLLSCTHVFHKACIQAFERFTGKKSCPMCRKEKYQTRVIYEGSTYHLHKCATRIQSLWRGYVAKSWYIKLRETVPPRDPTLRKKFYEQKLQRITDRMVQSVDTDVDGFLRDLDRSLEASRDVFHQFDEALRDVTEEQWEKIQLKLINFGASIYGDDAPLILSNHGNQATADTVQRGDCESTRPQTSDKAVERGCTDCPICLTPLEGEGFLAAAAGSSVCADTIRKSGTETSPSGRSVKTSSNIPTTGVKVNKSVAMGTKRTLNKPVITGTSLPCTSDKRLTVLLSCSHVFHQTCLHAFEGFTLGGRYVCPVCRSSYQKKVI